MIKEGYLNLSEEKLEVAIFNCEHYESMQEYLKEIAMGIEIMRLCINMRTDGNPNGYENFPITLKIEKV